MLLYIALRGVAALATVYLCGVFGAQWWRNIDKAENFGIAKRGNHPRLRLAFRLERAFAVIVTAGVGLLILGAVWI